ncbi:hypothetical protein HOLleu_36293 [Holothuria leucospilota]|uniref:Uncharacterized protein n=1 Tax=Holothuria leucospilota TaxID=206669 RepID=A0A9Q0YNC6_HOLLE|nr:hypothetical protein HOLleu_36293 [Holothuria leucospilota]
MRMEPAMFHELLLRVAPRIQKFVHHRQPLEPGIRLAIALRYLVTGISYKSLQFSFCVVQNTISLFIPEVCQAVIDEHQDEVFDFPTIPGGWREAGTIHAQRWNFHRYM